jgi:hypothetical protein
MQDGRAAALNSKVSIMESHQIEPLMPVFWGVFALALTIVPMILRHRSRLKTMEMMQKLLESGVTPPPEMLDILRQPRMPKTPRHDLHVGVVLLAIAGAMVILAGVLQFNGMGPHGIHPLFAVAFFPGMVGAALIGLWMVNPRRNDPS